MIAKRSYILFILVVLIVLSQSQIIALSSTHINNEANSILSINEILLDDVRTEENSEFISIAMSLPIEVHLDEVNWFVSGSTLMITLTENIDYKISENVIQFKTSKLLGFVDNSLLSFKFSNNSTELIYLHRNLPTNTVYNLKNAMPIEIKTMLSHLNKKVLVVEEAVYNGSEIEQLCSIISSMCEYEKVNNTDFLSCVLSDYAVIVFQATEQVANFNDKMDEYIQAGGVIAFIDYNNDVDLSRMQSFDFTSNSAEYVFDDFEVYGLKIFYMHKPFFS